MTTDNCDMAAYGLTGKAAATTLSIRQPQRNHSGDPREMPGTSQPHNKQDTSPSIEKLVIDPITLGFDKLIARFDTLDRRVESLERRPIIDVENPDEDFDEADREFDEYRRQGRDRPYNLGGRGCWGNVRGGRGDHFDEAFYRGRGGRHQQRRGGPAVR